ncbi:MAG: hypothetical protein WDO24_01950 [Pseudomonadota bacterium]
MTISLLLDVIVAILLAATIVNGAMLNRRLSGLRSNKAELEALIHSFARPARAPRPGVKTLRSATDEATRLQQYLDRSQRCATICRSCSIAVRASGRPARGRGAQRAHRDLAPADAERGQRSRARRRAGLAGVTKPVARPRPPSPQWFPESEPAPRVSPLRERAGAAEAAPRMPVMEQPAAVPEPTAMEAAERAAERLAQRVTLGDRPARAGRIERPDPRAQRAARRFVAGRRVPDGRAGCRRRGGDGGAGTALEGRARAVAGAAHAPVKLGLRLGAARAARRG